MSRGLVFGKKIEEMADFAIYFGSDYWENLQEVFKEAQFLVQGLTQQPLLETLIACGITALKTPFCSADNKTGYNCPICTEEVFPLAKDLPYTTKSASNLICRILGVIMDENNPPIVLPNKQVFSQKGIEKISKPIEGSTDMLIVCPITNKEFTMSQVTKIYLTS